MKPFYYFIPGIFTGDDPTIWSNRAQAWCVEQGIVPEGDASGFAYTTDAIGGLLTDNQLADMVAADLCERIKDGYTVNVAAHSNGCRIVCIMLLRHPDIVLGNVTLAAPAVNKDCRFSGLNLAAKQFASLVLCVSPKDEILSQPAVSYGTLGLEGPQNASVYLQTKMGILRRNCLHSDWVGKYFTELMYLATRAASSPPVSVNDAARVASGGVTDPTAQPAPAPINSVLDGAGTLAGGG